MEGEGVTAGGSAAFLQPTLSVSDHVGERHAECLGQLDLGGQGRVADTAFESADIGTVQTGPDAEAFLRPASGFSGSAHSSAEGLLDPLLRHAPTLRSVLTIRLERISLRYLNLRSRYPRLGSTGRALVESPATATRTILGVLT